LSAREEGGEVLDLEPEGKDVAGEVLAKDLSFSARDLVRCFLNADIQEVIVML